jgi:hypothetical protein
VPEKTGPHSLRSSRAVAYKKQPFDDLKQFIGICAQARKQLDPETINANVWRAVGEFFDGMNEDSKKLLTDVAGIIRRPK